MINYTDIGEGEELLLIHGLGSCIEAWNPQLPLSKKHRLIIVELRGHKNSNVTANLTVEQFAKDIIELMDHLNIKQAHICGLSLGGIIAQEIHKRYKSRVKSLILANTTFFIPTIVGKLSLNRTKHLMKSAANGSVTNEMIKTCLYDQKNQKNIQLVDDSFLIRQDTYYESAQSAFGRNYYLDLYRVSVPTLIIGSKEDKITPITSSYAMQQAIKNSKLVVFYRTGHLSNVEKAMEFNHAVNRHIKNYRGGK